jgi:hypothetical protein
MLATNDPNTVRFFKYADKYFGETPIFKVSDCLNQIVADYKNPNENMTLHDALHLAMRMGYLMKISHIEEPKL